VIAPHVIGLPRWVTLGSVGAALLMLGATWERRLDDVRRIRDEVAPRVAALR
jgi:hypothetical protein